MQSSSAKAFNTSSAQGTEPVFIYSDAVKEALGMFPDVAGKIFFLDTHARKVVHPGNHMSAEEACAFINDDFQLEKHLTECAAEKKHQYYMDGRFEYIIIYTGEDQNKILGYESSLAKSLYFAFDHELGHALSPHTNYEAERATPQLVESIADAYAAIRHFQRFGDDTTNIEKLLLIRAYRLFVGKPEVDLRHFTSPVIEQILIQKNSIDYESLSPDETRILAHRFATQFCMNEKDSSLLENQAHQVNTELGDLLHAHLGLAWEKALAKKALETDDARLFKWTNTILQGYFNKKFYDRKTGQQRELSGSEWDDIRQRLAQKQAEYNESPLLFGMKKQQTKSNVTAFRQKP